MPTLISEVMDKLYTETDSFEPIATDLIYLLAALDKGTCVTLPEPQTPPEYEGDRYTNTVKLLRHAFSPEHPVWNHIEIEPTDPVDVDVKRGEVVIVDGEPVCSLCGGSVTCNGTADVGMVPVGVDGLALCHDWMDAGYASFDPETYICAQCGTSLDVNEAIIEAALTEDDEADETDETDEAE